jgi:glycosyltransferase involved in cell wall biosynthesis
MGAASGGLRIAMLGTRGVPAAYGGFETAVEEIGARLAERGHSVTVYCRRSLEQRYDYWRGMRLVYAPALHLKSAETLSHTAFSTVHVTLGHRPDVAFVFNAANAPLVPMLRAVGVPTAVHVDGLEWMREKWKGAGRRYYRWAEGYAVQHADALIADARGIADYYRWKFDASTELLTYGTRLIEQSGADRIASLGLQANGYHLVVARFEPENHVDQIVAGYARSSSRLPLVIVGTAPYAARHIASIHALADADERIHMLGAVWDQGLLDELYANALTYVHGHSVGGTNPSLLRAMGAGTHVIAWDVGFNRDVAGSVATYFKNPEELSALLVNAESEVDVTFARGVRLRERARKLYDWDVVAEGYEDLALRLHRQSTGAAVPTHPSQNLHVNQEPTRP